MKAVSAVELYWDRPKSEWPRNADGSLAMCMRELDLDDLQTVPEARGGMMGFAIKKY